LHRNLVYLATIADSNQNMQSLLPAVSTNATTTYIYYGRRKCALIQILITVSKPFLFFLSGCVEHQPSEKLLSLHLESIRSDICVNICLWGLFSKYWK